MKLIPATLALALAVPVFAPLPALAGQGVAAMHASHTRGVPSAALPIGAITHALARQNYREIDSIRLQGPIYVVTAEDRRGRDVRLTVDAYSGHVIQVVTLPRHHHLTFARVERKLQRQGYTHVRLIQETRDEYRVAARGPRGAALRLVVDARSGQVIAVRPVGWRHAANDRFGWEPLNEYALRAALTQDRYSRVGAFTRQGEQSYVEAWDPRGRPVSLTLNVFTGEVVSIRPRS
ncbi:MAG: hypothetical protein GC199_06975 [Alphaproteobacteria bacterium]|nr:hypothetical protein [Alphaproteobacteria bacterium]